MPLPSSKLSLLRFFSSSVSHSQRSRPSATSSPRTAMALFGSKFSTSSSPGFNSNPFRLMSALKSSMPWRGLPSFSYRNLCREVISLRDRTKRNYSYACGLMVMLVRICGCRQGFEVFAARSHLLITLSELLLFAPQVRVLNTLKHTCFRLSNAKSSRRWNE